MMALSGRGISDFSLEADPVEFFDDLTSTALPQYS